MNWRMQKPCFNCPFNESQEGLNLRRSLRRWNSITSALLKGHEHFVCHKTSDDTGDGSNLVCAGSLLYQEENGTSSNLQRVMERIDWIYKNKEKV